jgi:hypothetical protein
MRAAAILLPLALTACAGSQLSGNRTASDNACGAVNANIGAGYVGLMPPGAIGELTINSTGCSLKITDWKFAVPLATTAVAATPAGAPTTLAPAAVVRSP